MVRLRHFDEEGTVRFITFSCYHKYALLDREDTIIPFLEELERARQRWQFHILGYVVMPDHVHLVVYSNRAIPIGKVIDEIKARSGYRIIREWRKENLPILRKIRAGRSRKVDYSFWQPRGYDHNCRRSETVREKILYCHMNPVKPGLVDDPGDWRWSSYKWYTGAKENPVTISEFAM